MLPLLMHAAAVASKGTLCAERTRISVIQNPVHSIQIATLGERGRVSGVMGATCLSGITCLRRSRSMMQ